MTTVNENPLPTSQTFEDMLDNGQPPQSYLDDEFTCVSDEVASISTKASGVYKKKNKPRSDRKGDKTIKYIENKKIIIHNAPFDLGFLDGELNALKKKLWSN